MPDACLPSTHLERSGGLPPRTCRLEKNEWLARRACHGGGIRLLGCCSWRRLGGRREKGEQWDFVFAPAVVSMRRAGNSRGDLAARTKRLDGTKKKVLLVGGATGEDSSLFSQRLQSSLDSKG